MGSQGPPFYGAALEDLIKHEFKIKSKSEVFAQIQEQDTHMGMAVYFGKCTAKAKYTTNPSREKFDSQRK